MLRAIIVGLVLLLPCVLSAQEGTIAFTHSVRIEIPEEIRARLEARGGNGGGGRGAFPTESVGQVVLLFNRSSR